LTHPMKSNGSLLSKQSHDESDFPLASTPTLSAIALVSACHKNAIEAIPRQVIIDFQPMQHIAKVCSLIFSGVDREDPLQSEAARHAWLVKASLMLTALPFDDTRLGVSEHLNALLSASLSIPSIEPAVNDLVEAVHQLVSREANPKREKILDLLRDTSQNSLDPAVLANVCGSPTPGWPLTITAKSDFSHAQLQLIRRKRQIRNSLYSRLIIPGNPWLAPRNLLVELIYGGRTPDVVVVSYRSEHSSLPKLKELPKDSFFSPFNRYPLQEIDSTVLVEDTKSEDVLARESLWTSIHSQHNGFTTTSESDVNVDATFVLFADGSGTFLPKKGSVVEVSDLFETGATFNVAEDKLPRTLVSDLDEGDLVMLRLSGSGDYLDEVSDALMMQAGESELRSCALQWKRRLEKMLKQHGEGVVAMKLRSLGVKLRSPQYLWEWAGDEVMAPHERQLFKHLIATIWQLEGLNIDEQPEIYANERWDEMERLKAYHHKAGAVIRSALLARVRELVVERRYIETVEAIELPDVASGRMGLLRVAAIDTISRRVSSSALFNLTKVKVP